MGALLLAAALAASPGAAPPLQPEATLTRAEARTLPREALNRRLFGPAAADLYYLVPYEEEEGLNGPLRELAFLSRPRAGSRAGTCESDAIGIQFEGVPGAAGNDPPARPAEVDRGSRRFIRDASALRAGAPPDPAREAQACAAADPNRLRPVFVANGAVLAAAVDDLIALVEAARAGRESARLVCSDPAGRVAGPRCLALVAGLRAGDVAVIYTFCGPGRDAPVCTVINMRSPDGGAPASQLVFERAVAGGPVLRVQLRPPREIDME